MHAEGFLFFKVQIREIFELNQVLTKTSLAKNINSNYGDYTQKDHNALQIERELKKYQSDEFLSSLSIRSVTGILW